MMLFFQTASLDDIEHQVREAENNNRRLRLRTRKVMEESVKVKLAVEFFIIIGI